MATVKTFEQYRDAQYAQFTKAFGDNLSEWQKALFMQYASIFAERFCDLQSGLLELQDKL